MNTRLSVFIATLILVSLTCTDSLKAQQGSTSAREAINLLSNQFGPGSVQWLAEIRGQNGIPQPPTWEVLSYNGQAPLLLHRFWSGGGRVGDAGADQSRYPRDIPVGYFSINQIVVDSVAAFTIAEGEARKARMAFDSCEYLLRVREYSTEAIWRLELLDAQRRLVGKIYVSAKNGEVLRTVWMYFDQGIHPVIIDSFAPSRQALSTGITGTTAPGQEPGIGQIPPMPPGIPPAGTGIAGAPAIPAPVFPSNNNPSGITQPYNPGTTAPSPLPSGNTGRYNDGGIPEPPSIANEEMRDLRDEPAPDPTKPPIEVPDSEGSSERIPPPPIPEP